MIPNVYRHISMAKSFCANDGKGLNGFLYVCVRAWVGAIMCTHSDDGVRIRIHFLFSIRFKCRWSLVLKAFCRGKSTRHGGGVFFRGGAGLIATYYLHHSHKLYPLEFDACKIWKNSCSRGGDYFYLGV